MLSTPFQERVGVGEIIDYAPSLITEQVFWEIDFFRVLAVVETHLVVVSVKRQMTRPDGQIREVI